MYYHIIIDSIYDIKFLACIKSICTSVPHLLKPPPGSLPQQVDSRQSLVSAQSCTFHCMRRDNNAVILAIYLCVLAYKFLPESIARVASRRLIRCGSLSLSPHKVGPISCREAEQITYW